SPRQATTASPAVVTQASPTVAQPPGALMSPWTTARDVQMSSQENPAMGHSLSSSPRRKLKLPNERSGTRANSVPSATRPTLTRYPTGTLHPARSGVTTTQDDMDERTAGCRPGYSEVLG